MVKTGALLLLGTLAAGMAIENPRAVGPWSKDFSPPEKLDTERIHLEPLAPEHAELDFKAVTSSREHLQRTLRWGDWPREDMTLEENRDDLAKHFKEFEERSGYAYTVLAPDRKKCLGCIYMKPAGGHPRAMSLAFWVVESELANDLDQHLLASVLQWIQRDWPVDRIVLPVHMDDKRTAEVAAKVGMRTGGKPRGERVNFFWRPKK